MQQAGEQALWRGSASRCKRRLLIASLSKFLLDSDSGIDLLAARFNSCFSHLPLGEVILLCQLVCRHSPILIGYYQRLNPDPGPTYYR